VPEAARSFAAAVRGKAEDWRQQGSLWLLQPTTPSERGLIEFIGGSYLAATPQLSYRRLLEALASRGWRVHAWSYVPGFDHQSQANEAWKTFRRIREQLGLVASGHSRPSNPAGLKLMRMGHSLGCKLHLLAPDAGRSAHGLVALAFNNFSAERSVPFLAEVGQQLGFRSEFSPSPAETLRIVNQAWRLPRNLLVRFERDELDQSARLLDALRQRPGDRSDLLELPGDHLTPASAGLRRNLLGDWADDPSRQRQIERLADQISRWIEDPPNA
jgi:hypothetical protein